MSTRDVRNRLARLEAARPADEGEWAVRIRHTIVSRDGSRRPRPPVLYRRSGRKVVRIEELLGGQGPRCA